MPTPHATGPNRVALAGADVSEPEETLAPMIEQYNRQPDAPFAPPLRDAGGVRSGGGNAWAADVSRYKGELNPIFQGTFSSRIELKQWLRRLEQCLTLAEKLACLCNWCGEPADAGLIGRAWEPVLFNAAHDLASGVMTDGVYADTLRSFEFSNRLAGEAVDTNFNALVSRVDTRGEGLAVVVFNPLGWPRTDVAELSVGFAEPGVKELVGAIRPVVRPRCKSSAPRATPTAGSRRPMWHSWPRTCRPWVTPCTASWPAPPPPARVARGARRRAGERVLPPHAGPQDRRNYQSACEGGRLGGLPPGANVVGRQADKGDLWSLYRGFNGAQKLFITDKQAVPQPGQAKFSNEFSGTSPQVSAGPVLADFELSHPLDNGAFATRVRLYAGSRRVDLRTRLVNNQRYVRYQALFPTTIRAGRTGSRSPSARSSGPKVSNTPPRIGPITVTASTGWHAQ